MAEEFQATICENWWNINSTRSVFPFSSSSACSMAANEAVGNYWHSDFMDMKGIRRSCADEETSSNLVSDGGSLDAQKPQQSESAGTGSSLLMDSTIQMMGFGLSSSTSSSNWNQSLFCCDGSRPESNFHSLQLQEETCIDSCDPQIQKDWSPINYSPGDAFKPMNQEFSLDQLQNQQSLNSVICSTQLPGGSPIGSAANSSYGYPSTLIQSLYEPDRSQQPQPQYSLFTNRPLNLSYSSSNEALLSSTWSTVSSLLKPSIMPKQQQQPSTAGLHFSNNTPLWNASTEALHDVREGVFASSSQAQYQTSTFVEKPNSPTTLLNKLKSEESSETAKKSACEPAFKRQRVETPSPLPTFKVRKEKLGDRITALQQLVSPFGKTDTASVLHEAIEYIKFLHDQVSVLSTPYMKNGAPIHHQQGCDNVKESEGRKQDLRSRGLCLVPISSTFPVATETTADFWTPTFGGALIR